MSFSSDRHRDENTMTKTLALIGLCALLLSSHVKATTKPSTHKGADTSQCEQQMQKVLSTTLDCTIKLQPDTLDEIVAFTNGAIESLHCSIPLRANKSAIYNHWIKDNLVELPALPVNCQIKGAQNNNFTATAKIRPTCRRISKNWNCQINLTDVQGLGFLGKPLEAYINTNQTLLSEMGKHLDAMSKAG